MAHIVFSSICMVDEGQIMIDAFVPVEFVYFNSPVEDTCLFATCFIVRPIVFITGIGVFLNEESLCLSSEYNTLWWTLIKFIFTEQN